MTPETEHEHLKSPGVTSGFPNYSNKKSRNRSGSRSELTVRVSCAPRAAEFLRARGVNEERGITETLTYPLPPSPFSPYPFSHPEAPLKPPTSTHSYPVE